MTTATKLSAVHRAILKQSRYVYADTADRWLASNGHFIAPVPTMDDGTPPHAIGALARRSDPADPWEFNTADGKGNGAASVFTSLVDTYGAPGERINPGKHAELVRVCALYDSFAVALNPQSGEVLHLFDAWIGKSRVPCALSDDYIRLFERIARQPRKFGFSLRMFADARPTDRYVSGAVAIAHPDDLRVLGYLMPCKVTR